MTPPHVHDHFASGERGEHPGDTTRQPAPGLANSSSDEPVSRVSVIGAVVAAILAGMPQCGVRGI
jgi:hypothetical protein